jgi:hypothetical protein
MALDVQALRELAERVSGHVSRGDKLNEANTKAVLVEPLLAWLGWNVWDPKQVSREWRRKGSEEPVDYALFGEDGSKLLLVEAKPLNDPLKADKGWKQLASNGFSAGFRWAARTNGRMVILVNLAHTGELEEKVFWEVDLAKVDTADGIETEEAATKLKLLSKDALIKGLPDEAWRDHHARLKADRAIRSLVLNPPEELIRMVCQRAGDAELPDDVVRACLSGLFGEKPGPTPVPPEQKPRRRGAWITVRELMDLGLVSPGDRWRLRADGGQRFAEITAEGALLVQGQKYATPFPAARAAAGKAVSGWGSWEFKDADGAWKPALYLMRKWRTHRRTARARSGAAGSPGWAETPQPSAQPQRRAQGLTVDSHLAGKAQSRAVYEALTRAISAKVGEFKTHATSKVIVLSARVAFLRAKAQSDGLRVDLRLDASEAARHARFDAHPPGVWRWKGFGVSTVVRTPDDVDEELLGLIKRAYEAAT